MKEELTDDDDELPNDYNCLVHISCLKEAVNYLYVCKNCGCEDLKVSHAFTYGVASCVEFRCASCEWSARLEPAQSKYASTKLKGKPSVLYYNENI